MPAATLRSFHPHIPEPFLRLLRPEDYTPFTPPWLAAAAAAAKASGPEHVLAPGASLIPLLLPPVQDAVRQLQAAVAEDGGAALLGRAARSSLFMLEEGTTYLNHGGLGLAHQHHASGCTQHTGHACCRANFEWHMPHSACAGSYGAALRPAVDAQRWFQVPRGLLPSLLAVPAISRCALSQRLDIMPRHPCTALACKQDRLEAQPVRFMETEALQALRHVQLAVAQVLRRAGARALPPPSPSATTLPHASVDCMACCRRRLARRCAVLWRLDQHTQLLLLPALCPQLVRAQARDLVLLANATTAANAVLQSVEVGCACATRSEL